jgi:predicted sugar kinase
MMSRAPGALLLGLFVFGSLTADARPSMRASAEVRATAEETAPTAALVKVRVVDEAGHEVTLGGHTVKLDETATVRATIDEHEHAVTLALTAGTDAASLSVGAEYAKDGGMLVDADGVAAKLGVPISIAGKDGKSKIVLVIEPRKKLELGEGDDPLGDL